MHPSEVLEDALSDARAEAARLPSDATTARLKILARHLEEVQAELGYSNKRMKNFLYKEGVGLKTMKTHGSTGLKNLLRDRPDLRLNREDVKKLRATKQCLLIM